MSHEEQINELKACLIKIQRYPKTEEEFICTLEFWGKFMVNHAAIEYGWPPLGIIPYGTKVDEQKITSNFNPKILKFINHLVGLACKKFNLTQLESEELEQTDLMTFESWFNVVAKKYGLNIRYEERIFNNRTLKISDG